MESHHQNISSLNSEELSLDNTVNSTDEAEYDYAPAPVKVTEAATAKVYQLMAEEGDLDLKLRVSITGGGCSGYQYHFAFIKEMETDDFPIHLPLNVPDKTGEVCVVIDPISLQYLAGAEIDFAEDNEGERFIIRNPKAKTTCGCGSSFSME